MTPTTSISLRKNELAAVEITALAAGAGPPANRIATRRNGVAVLGGRERDIAVCPIRDQVVLSLPRSVRPLTGRGRVAGRRSPAHLAGDRRSPSCCSAGARPFDKRRVDRALRQTPHG